MLKNMTQHPVVIYSPSGEPMLTIQPDKVPVRLETNIIPYGFIAHGDTNVPVTKTSFGQVVGLPSEQWDVWLIVSQVVKSALPGRPDLVVPADVVRDKSGNIIGCRSLGR
jgi:hypothetical protein